MGNKGLDIIIVGTGRCGTGFMSKLLTSAGIPCGHEATYSVTRGFIDKPDLSADSSWLVSPLLDDSRFDDTTIIHVVRKPLNIINSFISFGFYKDTGIYSAHYNHILKFIPSMNDYDNPINKAFCHVIEWSNMIFNYNKCRLHRIEDSPVELIKELGGSTDNLYCNNKCNTRTGEKVFKSRVTEDDIPDEWGDKYFELKEKCGYLTRYGLG